MKTTNRYLWIFVLAVLVRLCLAPVLFEQFGWPRGSSLQYRVGLASSIAADQTFSYNGIPNLYQLPLYPAFLAVIFFLLGNHWWSIAIFQSLLEGLTSVGIGKMAEGFSKSGWIAGAVYAIYPYAAVEASAIVDTTLCTFLFVFSIYFFVKFSRSGRVAELAVSSLLVGLGIVNRPSVVILFPVYVGSLFLSRKYPRRELIRYSLIISLMVALIPGLWILRNYRVTGQFPVFSVGGQHFMWYAHNQHIGEIYRKSESPDLVGVDPRYPMNPNVKVSEFFRASPAQQVALGKLCSEKAREWMRSHKLEVIKYSLLKLKVFFSCEYFPARFDQPLQILRLWVYRVSNCPILVLGWGGLLWALFRRKKHSLFFVGIVFSFILVHICSMLISRHKILLDSLLIVFIPVALEGLFTLFSAQGKIPQTADS